MRPTIELSILFSCGLLFPEATHGRLVPIMFGLKPIPTDPPTSVPSAQPSFRPSMRPTSSPSMAPSSNPTTSPSFPPSSSPTFPPTTMQPTINATSLRVSNNYMTTETSATNTKINAEMNSVINTDEAPRHFFSSIGLWEILSMSLVGAIVILVGFGFYLVKTNRRRYVEEEEEVSEDGLSLPNMPAMDVNEIVSSSTAWLSSIWPGEESNNESIEVMRGRRNTSRRQVDDVSHSSHSFDSAFGSYFSDDDGSIISYDSTGSY